MKTKALLCLLLLASVVTLSHAADKPQKPVKEKFDLNQVLQTVAREQDTDPVIGIWRTSAGGGYTWRTAITRNPNAASDGFEFIGILIQSLPFFKNGEIHLLLNRTAAPGEYTGKEKWKRLWVAWWETASFEITDDYHLVQTNNINFATPLGSEWRLLREILPELAQLKAAAPTAPAPSPNPPAVVPTPEPAREQALAPIPPPPPPADTPRPPPKTISLGQTKDEVVAILGQPQKVVKLAAKEMLYYPDMKVILIDQKVTDVQ